MKKLQLRPTFLALMATLIFGACSPALSPFTQSLYDSQRWEEAELRNIQFYLSDNIILRRQIKGGKSAIVGGEIKIIDGRKVEEVVFQAGTPGVLIFVPKENRFAISFEEKDDHFLMFGPNTKRGGKYMLLASDWDKRKGEVQYAGKSFYTASESSLATLLVDLKKIERVSIKSRKAEGRTIKG